MALRSRAALRRRILAATEGTAKLATSLRPARGSSGTRHTHGEAPGSREGSAQPASGGTEREARGGRFCAGAAPSPRRRARDEASSPRAGSQTKGRRSVTPSTPQPCLGARTEPEGTPKRGFSPPTPPRRSPPGGPAPPAVAMAAAEPEPGPAPRAHGGRAAAAGRGSALPGGRGTSGGAGSRSSQQPSQLVPGSH